MNRWLFLLAVALAACFTTGSFAGEKLEKPEAPTGRMAGPNLDDHAALPGPIGCPRIRYAALAQSRLDRAIPVPSWRKTWFSPRKRKTRKRKSSTPWIARLARSVGVPNGSTPSRLSAKGLSCAMPCVMLCPSVSWGAWLNACFVRSDLDSIFDYRARKVAALLGFELTHA